MGAVVIFGLFYAAILILTIAGGWKAFEKAGKPGWAFIIPVYQTIVMLEIAEKPIWWILLMIFLPIIGLIWAIMMLAAFVEKYGKGGGFVVGLIFLPFVFWPMLGFGDAKYLGGVTRRSAYGYDD